MTPRDRILDAAATVFGQYGFRLASMELVAQECGLTRQALYHHVESKEALFRAVVEAMHEGALEAERAAGLNEERAGKRLPDVMAAQLLARYRYLLDRLKGSAHAEELMSEHQRQTRDLLEIFIDHKFRSIVGTIERACAAGGTTLRDGISATELARSIELAARGFDVQKADANRLGDLARSIRLMVAGAIAERPQSAKPKATRRRP
jgi:AcrR family transcriptional regulator